MDETLAERFARLLFQQRRLSIEEVAATMKAGADAVRRIADGRTKQPRFDEMLRVCSKYGIDPYELAFGKATLPTSEGDVGDLARTVADLSRTVETLRQELLSTDARQAEGGRQIQERLQALEAAQVSGKNAGRKAI